MEGVRVARHLQHVGEAGQRPEARALREVEAEIGRRDRLVVERDGPLRAQLREDPLAVGTHPLLDVAEPDVVEGEVGAGKLGTHARQPTGPVLRTGRSGR